MHLSIGNGHCRERKSKGRCVLVGFGRKHRTSLASPPPRTCVSRFVGLLCPYPHLSTSFAGWARVGVEMNCALYRIGV
jgi:hypothetical protein